MPNPVVLITGANSGIGYRAAQILSSDGFDVILACRNPEKGKTAEDQIKKGNPQAHITFMQLDLADLASIHDFVDEFHKSGKSLYALVNNAGVTMDFRGKERSFTKDGFEVTMGTNHLGHFHLTNLLLDDLKKTAAEGGEARVVVVASSLHDPKRPGSRNQAPVPINFDDLCMANEGAYSGFNAYRTSKAANVLFSHELARRLEGTGVTVNCLCPGFIPDTNLGQNQKAFVRFLMHYVLSWILWWKGVTSTVDDGANRICDLVRNKDYKDVTGKYFSHSKISESSEETNNEDNQRRLWEVSTQLIDEVQRSERIQ